MTGLELLKNHTLERSLGAVDDTVWSTNNSSFADYGDYITFAGRDKSLQAIVDRAGIKNGAGLDIAGGTNGVALRDLLDSGILSKALVTNYQDRRSRAVRRDSRLGHVDGDIMSLKTWDKIFAWHNANTPEGFDLILHRPWGGLQNKPPQFYRAAAHALLDMLHPGGIFFTQLPGTLLVDSQEHKMTCQSLRNRNDIASIKPSIWPTGPFQYVVIQKRFQSHTQEIAD